MYIGERESINDAVEVQILVDFFCVELVPRGLPDDLPSVLDCVAVVEVRIYCRNS